MSNTAFFTFVALDKQGNKVIVPEVEPETDVEKELYETALQRRQMRLLVAGKIKPDQAHSLKDLFGLKD